MSLTFEEIILTKYPTEIKNGLIKLKDENDGNGVIIDEWHLEEPQPDLQTVMSWDTPELQLLFTLADTKKKYSEQLQELIDLNAQEKSYEDGVSCASYINSTNLMWKQEALTFIAWRDDCWEYAYNIQTRVENGEIEPPTIEDFINNAPAINWPE